MSGAAAARKILDSNGLYNVPIEMTHGYLSDHYDPSTKVVRLSEDVYQGHSMAAVGIAAHEVGHAIQDARNYLPLVIRNVAVPVAGFGSSLSQVFLIAALGLMFAGQNGLATGAMLLFVVGFSATVLFQIGTPGVSAVESRIELFASRASPSSNAPLPPLRLPFLLSYHGLSLTFGGAVI